MLLEMKTTSFGLATFFFLGKLPFSNERKIPGYAVMVALACVGGACGDLDPRENMPNCDTCPQKLNLELTGSSLSGSICNNATFTWMTHALLAEISKEKEEISDKIALIEDYVDELDDANQKIDLLVNFVLDLQEAKSEILRENKILKREMEIIKDFEKSENEIHFAAQDCADIQRAGSQYSGLYTIYPHGFGEGMVVFCDLETDNGGWLVLQRRGDGSQDFAQNWNEYKYGFGDLISEFYLGNDKIHKLTYQRRYMLRIDMEDFEGNVAQATYDRFMVDGEEENYRLKIGGYSGDAGDSLTNHNRSPFSTHDVDNDESRSGQCSQLYGNGGGWFVQCYDANLNGQYGQEQGQQGIVWIQWTEDFTPLKYVDMKIRPVDFIPHE